MQHKSKHRVLSALLTLLFLLTLAPLSVSAASSVEIQTIWYSRGGVNWGTDTWGHPKLKYMNGWDEKEIDHYVVFAAANLDYDIAYCVQPNIPLDDGDIRNSKTSDNFLSDYDNGTLAPAEIETLLGRIYQYGYTGKAKTDFTDNQIAKVIATQVLVWEVIVGERGSAFEKIKPPSGVNAVLDSVGKKHPLRTKFLSHYDTIVSSVQQHITLPSFANAQSSKATTYEPDWSGTNYSVTLIDNNAVLSGYDVSCSDSSITLTRSGNELKITSQKPIPKSVQVKVSRSNNRKAVSFWASGSIKDKDKKQGLSTVGKSITDSQTGFFNLKTAVGFLELTKQGESFASVAEQDGMYQPVYQTLGLGNAVFEVTAAEDILRINGSVRHKKGAVIATLTTDSSGTAKSGPLYLGKYQITETTTPANMVLDKTPVIIELKQSGDTVPTEKKTIENLRQKVRVSLKKTLEQNEPFNLGFGEEYKAVQFGLFADEELTARDSTVIPKDGLIELLTLDDTLSAAVQTDLPHGNYYIKEVATDEHYILPDTKFPVAFAYETPEPTHIDFAVNDENPIHNDLYRGKIRGQKVCEDGPAMEGVLFGLFSAGETEFSKETAIQTCATDKDGYFLFENVFVGSYLVKELETLTGYVLTEQTYKIEVKATHSAPTKPEGEKVESSQDAPTKSPMPEQLEIDPTLIEIPAITNRYTKIRIYKVNEAGNPLPGATFQLIDSNGVPIATWTTGSEPQSFDRLPIGAKYTILETKAPDGYEFARTRDIVVQNTAEEQVITIENHLRPAIVTPQTGDNRPNPIFLWIVLAVSIVGIGFIIFDKVRKKKQP